MKRTIAPALVAVAVPLFAGTTPDAGLNTTFLYPAPTTGTTRDITTFGATPGNDSDDDAVAINAAITASSAGDEVYIPDGTWNTMTTIVAKSGVAIRGQSEAGTNIVARFSIIDQDTITFNAGRTDVTVSDLTIDSDGSEPPRNTIQIGRNTGSDTERIHVRDVTIRTFFLRGIMVRGGRHVKIENCTISDATALGGGEGYGITIQQPNCDNNWVTGCEINGPNIRHAILLQVSTNHNLIELNTIDQTSEDAIDLHGEDEYSNEIRYNTVTNSARSAIAMGNTGGTVLMHDASGPNNWIHHNTVRTCLDGIEVIQMSDTQFIENNDVRFCTNYGIRIYDLGANDISITDNVVLDCGTGIRAEDALNMFVDGNTVTDHAGYGIRTSSTVTGYTITNNNFSCNGTAKSLGSASGTYSGNTEGGPCILPVTLDAFEVR